MREGEILVEAPELLRKSSLLLPYTRVHVLLEPIFRPIEETPTASLTRQPDHCEPAFPIHAADVAEAKKLERLRLLPRLGQAFSSKAPEDESPRLLRSQLESELR